METIDWLIMWKLRIGFVFAAAAIPALLLITTVLHFIESKKNGSR